jgi:hypothetical protein
MRLAVNVLLNEAGEIGDGLEAELYAFRDRLDVMALEAVQAEDGGVAGIARG